MDTDLPASVSPFDGAFDGPMDDSHQGADMVPWNVGDELVYYDPDNQDAWIHCENPLDAGGGR